MIYSTVADYCCYSYLYKGNNIRLLACTVCLLCAKMACYQLQVNRPVVFVKPFMLLTSYTLFFLILMPFEALFTFVIGYLHVVHYKFRCIFYYYISRFAFCRFMYLNSLYLFLLYPCYCCCDLSCYGDILMLLFWSCSAIYGQEIIIFHFF